MEPPAWGGGDSGRASSPDLDDMSIGLGSISPPLSSSSHGRIVEVKDEMITEQPCKASPSKASQKSSDGGGGGGESASQARSAFERKRRKEFNDRLEGTSG